MGKCIGVAKNVLTTLRKVAPSHIKVSQQAVIKALFSLMLGILLPVQCGFARDLWVEPITCHYSAYFFSSSLIFWILVLYWVNKRDKVHRNTLTGISSSSEALWIHFSRLWESVIETGLPGKMPQKSGQQEEEPCSVRLCATVYWAFKMHI